MIVSDVLLDLFLTNDESARCAVVFGEYLGENSFAVQYLDSDKKDIVLFDVNLYKRGFIY